MFFKIIFIILFYILNLNICNDKNVFYIVLLYIEKFLNGFVFSFVLICMLILFLYVSLLIFLMISNVFFGICCEYCVILRIRMVIKFKY